MSANMEILAAIKSVLEAETVSGGELDGVKWLDYGATIPPLNSVYFPLIFATIDGSVYPIQRAARGEDEAYGEVNNVYIVVASYIIKANLAGYKAAFEQAGCIAKRIIKLCHANKKWSGTCWKSEAAEEEGMDWGIVPWGVEQRDVVYAITIPVMCHTIST